ELRGLSARKEALARAAVGIREQDVEGRARGAQVLFARLPRPDAPATAAGCPGLRRHHVPDDPIVDPILRVRGPSARPGNLSDMVPERSTPSHEDVSAALWWGRPLSELRWQAEVMRLLVDPVFHGIGVA